VLLSAAAAECSAALASIGANAARTLQGPSALPCASAASPWAGFLVSLDIEGTRAVTVTPKGQRGIKQSFGVEAG